jgi:hypothetical protein
MCHADPRAAATNTAASLLIARREREKKLSPSADREPTGAFKKLKGWVPYSAATARRP